MKILSYAQLTVNGSAQGLPSVPDGAVGALVILERGSGTETVNARFREDGSPTASVGMPLGQLGVYEVSGSQNIANFLIISADGNSHTLNIQYR